MKIKLLVPIEKAISESKESTQLDENARRILAVIVIKRLRQKGLFFKAKKLISEYQKLYPGIFPKE